MIVTTPGRKVSLLESIGAHMLLIAAVAFALYPVLWVVSLAFSGATDLEPRVLRIPIEPTLEHLRGVVGSTLKSPGEPERWLFGVQLLNSLVISLATAAVGILIAVPTAYALARFEFVGKDADLSVLADIESHVERARRGQRPSGARRGLRWLSGLNRSRLTAALRPDR